MNKFIHKPLIGLSVIALMLGIVSPALAVVPTAGTVVEGVSVPGASLGDTRSEVETSFGAPSSCQSSTAGDLANCRYIIDDVGTATARYKGADGGNATASGSDVVFAIDWTGLSEWVTTAGIHTTLALDNMEAVAAAYPNADVTYDQYGDIFSVRDNALGIMVTRATNPYPLPSVNVIMSIFAPTENPGEPVTDTVEIINATYDSRKGELSVEAISSHSSEAVLSVEGFGIMNYNTRKNVYKLNVIVVSSPDSVTVTSSNGGTDTADVTSKAKGKK